jgi:flavodoxin
MKILVAYFSASGVTAKVAKKLAEVTGAQLYDIVPAVIYNTADLDWRNPKSRSSVEMNDKNCRPKLLDRGAPVAGADVVFVGYPVWWYREPSIIDSFLEAYDFTGKKIVPFVTSGGSEIGEEAPKRIAEISGAEVLPGKRFDPGVSKDVLKAWAESILGG